MLKIRAGNPVSNVTQWLEKLAWRSSFPQGEVNTVSGIVFQDVGYNSDERRLQEWGRCFLLLWRLHTKLWYLSQKLSFIMGTKERSQLQKLLGLCETLFEWILYSTWTYQPGRFRSPVLGMRTQSSGRNHRMVILNWALNRGPSALRRNLLWSMPYCPCPVGSEE